MTAPASVIVSGCERIDDGLGPRLRDCAPNRARPHARHQAFHPAFHQVRH